MPQPAEIGRGAEERTAPRKAVVRSFASDLLYLACIVEQRRLILANCPIQNADAERRLGCATEELAIERGHDVVSQLVPTVQQGACPLCIAGHPDLNDERVPERVAVRSPHSYSLPSGVGDVGADEQASILGRLEAVALTPVHLCQVVF